ncbi:phage Gp37/Gp68 family protein [Caballeronia sp. NK8]|uniref:phage Gp37/Gp68 family protein n=1 Tax=Caballeronia sp. NK8 TaxID=140098 RepID=UPI001BB7CC84|nr:phage Gp37/Gp68 family protein [Caballeronia sp. NK8]BCQ23117.1 phage Gp37/Gp68 family protein [Caballeronia sp. NK8]
MSENSKIEWTDHTFNPWEGCQKVGPGCDHCYAETRNARFAGGNAINWGPGAPRRLTAAANWHKPVHWDKAHSEFFAKHGRRQRVFCASLADVFDNAVPEGWRAALFDLIAITPNLDWLLLTKRIGNAEKMITRALEIGGYGTDARWPWANVWLGATIVNQEEADRDIPKLLMTPARRRFLSMEPLLGPVDLLPFFDPTGNCCMQEMQSCENCPADAPWIHGPTTEYAEDGSGYSSPTIDWVIVGGESGNNARPMHPDWAREIRGQCEDYGVPFLFKQWGEWAPGENCGGPMTRTERTADWFGDEWSFGTLTPRGAEGMHCDDEPLLYRCGKKKAGRHLDGVTHDGFPS